VIQAAPNASISADSATLATTQDDRLSIEDEGLCSIDVEPGWPSLLQAAHDLTSRARRGAAAAAALRQNARGAAWAKFHCKPRSRSEILRRLLNELT
jgi:hypothetical protein